MKGLRLLTAKEIWDEYRWIHVDSGVQLRKWLVIKGSLERNMAAFILHLHSERVRKLVNSSQDYWLAHDRNGVLKCPCGQRVPNSVSQLYGLMKL